MASDNAGNCGWATSRRSSGPTMTGTRSADRADLILFPPWHRPAPPARFPPHAQLLFHLSIVGRRRAGASRPDRGPGRARRRAVRRPAGAVAAVRPLRPGRINRVAFRKQIPISGKRPLDEQGLPHTPTEASPRLRHRCVRVPADPRNRRPDLLHSLVNAGTQGLQRGFK